MKKIRIPLKNHLIFHTCLLFSCFPNVLFKNTVFWRTFHSSWIRWILWSDSFRKPFAIALSKSSSASCQSSPQESKERPAVPEEGGGCWDSNPGPSVSAAPPLASVPLPRNSGGFIMEVWKHSSIQCSRQSSKGSISVGPVGRRRVQERGRWPHPCGWDWVTRSWETQRHGRGVVWLTSGLQRKALSPSTLRRSSKRIFKGWGRKEAALSCRGSDALTQRPFRCTPTSCESRSQTVRLLFDKSVLFQIRYLVNSGSNCISPLA